MSKMNSSDLRQNPHNQTSQNHVSVEEVIWAYKLFLDREPESQEVIDGKVENLSSTVELRKEVMASDEFKLKNPWNTFLTMSGNEPSMPIDEVLEINPLFSRIQETWEHLGGTDPYWSVITHEEYKHQNIEKNREKFYLSGRDELAILLNSLERNGLDYRGYQDCLEFGCGIGRITRWLAEKFSKVYGYDISQSHLSHAKAYLEQTGISNVCFEHIKTPQDFYNLPKVDVVYSIIVLQHNPPPIMALMIGEMIKALRHGGVAFFQVPTYRLGYQFDLENYLLDHSPKQEFEMHILPQKKIFEIVDRENGKMIEVLEDGYAGLAYGARSNIFIVQKK